MNKNEFESQRINMIAGERRILRRYNGSRYDELGPCAKCFWNTLCLPLVLLCNLVFFICV